jgi:hypothetical protein
MLNQGWISARLKPRFVHRGCIHQPRLNDSHNNTCIQPASLLMLLKVYIPNPGSIFAEMIAPKSGIVAKAAPEAKFVETGRIHIYYEGNLHRAVNLVEFYDRVVCAAGRLSQSYPTIAQQFTPADQLIAVAEFDAANNAFTTVYDADALTGWADEPIEQIVGARLPDGPCDWMAAAKLCQNARPIGPQNADLLRYQTRAGQIISFEPARKTATVG